MATQKEKNNHYAVKDNGMMSISVKDVDTQSRTICAVLNTFNYLDSDGDILLPGCCKTSIKERGVDSSRADKIVHALHHDLTRLPGKILTLDERIEDGKSCLYMESKLADTTDGNDTLQNYLEGIYNQHSIGFRYMKYQWMERDSQGWNQLMNSILNPEDCDGKEAVFVVDEIKLYEGSTVAFGANSLTPCVGIKSENKDSVMLNYMSMIDRLEKTLRKGTQSDGMMYKIELQVLQLKQELSNIFEKFTVKNIKEETKPDGDKPSSFFADFAALAK